MSKSPNKKRETKPFSLAKPEAFDSNQAIIDLFYSITSSNDQLITVLQTDKTVRYPQYSFGIDQPTLDRPPVFSVHETIIERSSLDRLKEWTTTKDPAIKPLPLDIFNLKTDFTVSILDDLIRLNKAQREEVQRYAFFGESPACKASLMILLQNAQVIEYHLTKAMLLTESSESRKEECQQVVEEMHGVMEKFKSFDMKWSLDYQSQLNFIGASMSHVSALTSMLQSSTVDVSKLTLRYRATKDGFRASDFHRCCDGHPNLLVVIKSSSGYIFGGYTSVAFQSNGQHVNSTDGRSFLYTLTNSYGSQPTKLPISNGQYTIYCDSSYGPTFGSGHDLHICDSANVNGGSCSGLPNSYSDPTGKGNTLFTGNRNLGTIAEILAFN